MLYKLTLLILTIPVFACNTNHKHTLQQLETFSPTIQNFAFPFNIRAIQAIDEHTAWYAGYGGQFGYTEDGGKTWHNDSIRIDDYVPQFRSIVVQENTVFIISVGSPAIVFMSVDNGKSWEETYREEHPDCYYNSLAFWDEKEGIATGDIVEGCLSVIITRDGGESWQKLPCDLLPDFVEDEGGFAASNTNIEIQGDHVWFVTGGKKARVFHSADRGRSWEVFDTPITQGGNMTGIYSVDFRDEENGIIFGGDWEDQANNRLNKAITKDGGKSWQLISDGKAPGFRSCVQYIPGSKGQQILAIGLPGLSYSSDGGKSWNTFSNESYYTIRIVDSGNVAWMGGQKRMARMEW